MPAKMILEHGTFFKMVEGIIMELRPELYELDAGRGDDCQPFSDAYDQVEWWLNNAGIYDENYRPKEE